jgi:hypothetical protein
MLTTKERTKRSVSETKVDQEDVLKFASQNQQLEGFPGKITEACRQHRTDWDELEAVAKRFGAQMPKRPSKPSNLESLKTPR